MKRERDDGAVVGGGGGLKCIQRVPRARRGKGNFRIHTKRRCDKKIRALGGLGGAMMRAEARPYAGAHIVLIGNPDSRGVS